jgi:hypothetical protein
MLLLATLFNVSSCNLLGELAERTNANAKRISGTNMDSNVPMQYHPAAVSVGDAVAWQELAGVELLKDYSTRIITGNLDDDPDVELLLAGDLPQILELDGTHRELPGSWDLKHPQFTWDMDGDGSSEIVCTKEAAPGSSQASFTTVVCNPEGAELLQVQGICRSSGLDLPDIDGDGAADLLSFASGADSRQIVVKAWGRNGKEIWTANAGTRDDFIHGDIDGDCRDEILMSSAEGQQGFGPVTVYGVDQKQSGLPGVTDNLQRWRPGAVANLHGNGKGLIAVDNCLFDPVKGSKMPLEKPPGWPEMRLGGYLGHSSAELKWKGSRVLAMTLLDGGSEMRSDTLAMWNAGGELVYLEHLGVILQEIRTLHTPGGDRLLMVTESGLLITP